MRRWVGAQRERAEAGSDPATEPGGVRGRMGVGGASGVYGAEALWLLYLY